MLLSVNDEVWCFIETTTLVFRKHDGPATAQRMLDPEVLYTAFLLQEAHFRGML